MFKRERQRNRNCTYSNRVSSLFAACEGKVFLGDKDQQTRFFFAYWAVSKEKGREKQIHDGGFLVGIIRRGFGRSTDSWWKLWDTYYGRKCPPLSLEDQMHKNIWKQILPVHTARDGIEVLLPDG